MEQQKLMLFNYLLLLFPIKVNSSGITTIISTIIIITTRITPTTTSVTSTIITKAVTTPPPGTSTTAHPHLHHHIERTSFYTGPRRDLTTSSPLTPAHPSRMGSCFGRTKEPTSTAAACLWRHATDEQEAELMEEADEDEMNPKKQKYIFRIIKFKRKQKRKQFMEKFWQRHETNYSQLSSRIGTNESTSEIQLQNLDVNHLLTSNTLASESVMNAASAAAATAHFSSRTSSSLDLEWEHEYFSHMRPYPLALLPPTTKPITIDLSSVAVATASTPKQRNAVELGLDASWQFLSQCRYFDEESMNSLNSQHNSLAPPTAEPTNTEPARERTTSSSAAEPTGNSTQTKPWYSNSSCKLQQQHNVLRPIASSSFTRTSSRNSCSHISSCSSLEWDIDEEQQRQMHVEDDNLGLETLDLLHQIEQLKNKVLNETGDGLTAFDDIEGFTNIRAEFFEEIDIS